MQCKLGYVLNAIQLELTHVGIRRVLTHVDIQYEREITHVGYIERELTHVENILMSLYGSEQFCMEEEQFSNGLLLISRTPKLFLMTPPC